MRSAARGSGSACGWKGVREGERGATGRPALHRGSNSSLGGKVQIGCRLIEQQDGRFNQLGASEREQLAVTGRQGSAAPAELVQIAPVEFEDELVCSNRARRGLNLGIRRLRPAVCDVVTNRA